MVEQFYRGMGSRVATNAIASVLAASIIGIFVAALNTLISVHDLQKTALDHGQKLDRLVTSQDEQAVKTSWLHDKFQDLKLDIDGVKKRLDGDERTRPASESLEPTKIPPRR